MAREYADAPDLARDQRGIPVDVRRDWWEEKESGGAVLNLRGRVTYQTPNKNPAKLSHRGTSDPKQLTSPPSRSDTTGATVMHGHFNRPANAGPQGASAEKFTALLSSRVLVVGTFRQRDQWARKAARDRRMKLTHRHVLRSLSLCVRLGDDGRLVIDPTYDELADAACCCRRTAIYAIEAAEEIGIVRKARHSDGRVSNRFDLLLPNDAANGDKNAENPQEKTKEIQGPTVHEFAGAEGSNGASACTV
jgi:hypothetical protein